MSSVKLAFKFFLLRIFTFILPAVFTTGAFAASFLPNLDLVGKWQFHKINYNGEVRPLPNPNLVMQFEFFEDGTDRLSWYRKNEDGFCERMGRYSYDGQSLTDEVTWVNPKNTRDCSSDPDMQVGKISTNLVQVSVFEFYLHLGLGDKPIIYIWKKIDNNEP